MCDVGALRTYSTSNLGSFGYWQSPTDAVPIDTGYLYRAVFTATTDITDQSMVPQVRFRANSLNLQQSDYITIESTGDGGASPVPGGTDYALYFVPPSNDTFMMLAFDLLNFNPDDAAMAEVALEQVIVDRFMLAGLSTPTVSQAYTFNATTDGWTTGGAPIVFTPPIYSHAEGALQLQATTNTDTFGYWQSDPADVVVAGSALYRGTFEVRTDVTDQSTVPQMRLRFNTENLQASRTFGVESIDDGGMSPLTTNTIYDGLYFLPPVNAVGGGLIVSFDILNFTPEDAATGALILDAVTVETLIPPTAP